MPVTLRDIELPEIRHSIEAALKRRSKGTPYGVRITRMAFPEDKPEGIDVTVVAVEIQIDYQQPTDTRPSEQKLLTDTSITAIEESLTDAVRSVTSNDDYDVQIQEFRRTDELGSLAITMRALVPVR